MQIDMSQISGITKWRNYFRDDITTDLYKTTRHTDLLYFQYKLVHFILTTNENLFRWKMTDSDIHVCVWCQEKIETIPHIFLECEVVKSFWSDIKHWICQKTNILININNKELILGINNPDLDQIQKIYLFAKRYIYILRNVRIFS